MNNVESLQISSAAELVGLFDHAILQPTFTDKEMQQQLQSLRRFPLASVCIKPYAVRMAVRALLGTKIVVGTVIGFPHGSALIRTKAAEAELAFRDGAADVDVVVNVGKVLSNDWDYVYSEIGTIKVIFETDYLTKDCDKIRIC